MANPFGTDEMAAGYARSRPPVHARIVEKAYRLMAWTAPVARALDVGCGAGISTRALDSFARHRIGMEPAEAMLRWTETVAPGADFTVGAAEALPVRGRSIDLITAAGSLNYVRRLERFFAEALRVLAAGGALVVYDFSAGRSLRGRAGLDEWFERFTARYPYPASEARALSPEVLAGIAAGFRMAGRENFEIGITLTPEFYLDYMLTETNVAAAVRAGARLAEIRSWCAETLAPVWEGRPREVLFRGYVACMKVDV
jgi:SAM-dependent methyltransferase